VLLRHTGAVATIVLPRERRNEIATIAIARKINNLEDIHIFTAFRTQGTVRFKRSQSANVGIGVCASGISTLLSGQLKRIGIAHERRFLADGEDAG
jgi:hypothetical protein